eukprot:15365890-Ditylum_brightwellii.AAC.1
MACVPFCRVANSSLCSAAGDTWKVPNLLRSAVKSGWNIVVRLFMKDIARALGGCFSLKALLLKQ